MLNQTLEEQLKYARALLSVASKRIEVLEGKVKLFDSKEMKDLLYTIDGFQCEYMERNYGEANNWLRHISSAYEKYQEKEG